MGAPSLSPNESPPPGIVAVSHDGAGGQDVLGEPGGGGVGVVSDE